MSPDRRMDSGELGVLKPEEPAALPAWGRCAGQATCDKAASPQEVPSPPSSG
jgi:hypothetical protein